MKKKFFCDMCGQDFDTEKECDEHERKCSKIDALEKRVRGLELKVDILEKFIDIWRQPNTAPSSPVPPYVPWHEGLKEPWGSPVIWAKVTSTTSLDSADAGAKAED